MGTNKPRVSVTLEPEQHDVLARLAALEGRSIGSLVRELVDAVEPGLRRTVELGEAYQQATTGARDALRRAVTEADEDVTQGLDQLEDSALELLSRIDSVLASGGDPRPVITGVRSEPNRSDKGK